VKLQILSFGGKTFESDKVVSITIMTKSWEITILDKHTPLITVIKPSTMYIIYKDENNMQVREDFVVWWGILEVSWSNVKIMADLIIDIEEVDRDKAEEAKIKAEELMKKYKDSKDKVDMEKFIEAEDMLLKSIAQLKLSDLKK